MIGSFDPFPLTSSLLLLPPLLSCAGLALQVFVMSKDDLSGADIKAVCSEAGLLALRERRMRVTQDDFLKAKEGNTACIHCKAGKGRTGLTIVCLLLYRKHASTCSSALSLYACRPSECTLLM